MADCLHRILVLEADEGLASVIGELLRREEAEVTIVQTVREAFTELAAKRPDVVILDVDAIALRSRVSEFVILGQWWRAQATPPPPLILLSVLVPSAQEIGNLPTLQWGADHSVEWLRKPFRKMEFLAVIQQGLQKVRQPSLKEGEC